MTLTETPTGMDLIQSWETKHTRSPACLGCGQDCRAVALVDVAYVFASCQCGTPEYSHLVERIWHLACLQDRRPEVDVAARHALGFMEKYERTNGVHADRVKAELRVALRERGTGE